MILHVYLFSSTLNQILTILPLTLKSPASNDSGSGEDPLVNRHLPHGICDRFLDDGSFAQGDGDHVNSTGSTSTRRKKFTREDL